MSGTGAPSAFDCGMTFTTLISVDGLKALLARGVEDVVVFDTRFDLANPQQGQTEWQQGHVPSALYLNLDDDLSGRRTGRNGRHPLPDRARLAAKMGQCGVAPKTQVVAYDAQGGMFAARLWWLLRWLGHEAVAVLDGGMSAWQKAGHAITTGQAPLPTEAAPYPDRPSRVESVDIHQVFEGLGRVRLIDARAPERFRGDVEPLDAAAGHIPGATNRWYQQNLQADGRFKSAAVLREEYALWVAPDGDAQGVVHQCGSGVSACHNLLAMTHAGLAGSKLYVGSWSEWSADPSKPVALGS